MVDQTKKDLNMNRWIHMPKASEEYAYYKALCGNYEACAFESLGGASLFLDSSQEDKMIAIMHLKKARAIYNLVGMKHNAQQIDTLISMYTAKQAANEEDTVTFHSEAMKNRYELNLHTKGMDSADTIRSGLTYA
jgi:hypothetical protein